MSEIDNTLTVYIAWKNSQAITLSFSKIDGKYQFDKEGRLMLNLSFSEKNIQDCKIAIYNTKEWDSLGDFFTCQSVEELILYLEKYINLQAFI